MPRFCWPRDEDRSFWQDWTEGVSMSASGVLRSVRQDQDRQAQEAREGIGPSRASGTGWAAAAAPFALPGDHKNYLRDREFDVKHIKIEVTLDVPNKRVRGTTTLTLEALTGTSERVELDAEDMEVSSVRSGRRELPFNLTDHQLFIELPGAPAAGKTLDISVEYVSTPQRGIYFTGPDKGYPNKPHQVWTQGQDTDNHHWFPCIDEPKGRLTSEVIATVPAGWTAVSNGRLVSVSDATAAEMRGLRPSPRPSQADLRGLRPSPQPSPSQGEGGRGSQGEGREGSQGEGPKARREGFRTFHWMQDKPHAVYLITLAAAEFSHVVLQEKGRKGPLVDFYCQPGREEDGRRSFGNTPAMIKLYEGLFGEPYPWDKYTQVAVQDFIFGGMENTSATTQTDLTLHDARAHVDFSSDFLVAHEAVHQWFGDLLTCREWPHSWLNEGFATFFESVWQEHHHGLDEYLYDMLGLARNYLGERYRRPIVERTYNVPVDIFDRHLYDKAGVVLHLLRRELGDGPFYRAIKRYMQQHKGRNVVTLDFQRAVEDATGRNMDWFFDQWVYSPGHPEIKATYAWDGKLKVATLGVRQTQDGEGVPNVFRAAVDVAFTVGGKRQVERVRLTERDHTFTFALAERPKMIQFDAGFGLLKTLDFDKPKDMLIYQLEHDDDLAGRLDAARGLARHTSPDSVQALKRAVQKGGFWGVQVTAGRALGEMKTEAALDALLDCVKVEHPKARRGVAEALGNFKDARAARALTRLLDDPQSYYVASTAASSLGKTRQESAFRPLVTALSRESHGEVVRVGAMSGLSEFRGDTLQKARKLVMEWTEYGRPARAREAAIGALAKLGHDDKDTVERLTDLLDDRWYRARLFAVNSLAELKEPDAVPALQRLASRELDGRVVRSARVAVNAIRASRRDDTTRLREDFNKIEDENRKLRERFDKLEQRLDREKKPGAVKKPGATRSRPALKDSTKQ